MGYTFFLKPRAETLAGEIEGIIDLANLGDTKRRRLEARPDQFFALSYPTADVRHVVSLLDQRLAGGGATPGLFLFEGLKGSGKSHLLLLVYHLSKNLPEARKWLERHGLTCRLPAGVIPVVNKFTDLPLLSIWDFQCFLLPLPRGERVRVRVASRWNHPRPGPLTHPLSPKGEREVSGRAECKGISLTVH